MSIVGSELVMESITDEIPCKTGECFWHCQLLLWNNDWKVTHKLEVARMIIWWIEGAESRDVPLYLCIHQSRFEFLQLSLPPVLVTELSTCEVVADDKSFKHVSQKHVNIDKVPYQVLKHWERNNYLTSVIIGHTFVFNATICVDLCQHLLWAVIYN